MAAINVDKLSLREIEALENRIAAAKVKAADAAKADVKAKIESLLAQSGFTIGDIYPQAARGSRRGKGAAKFANPDNRSQTWTGRGRRPDWLLARLKKGEKLEKFAI
jgi:DNA-binding protein H-NS